MLRTRPSSSCCRDGKKRNDVEPKKKKDACSRGPTNIVTNIRFAADFPNRGAPWWFSVFFFCCCSFSRQTGARPHRAFSAWPHDNTCTTLWDCVKGSAVLQPTTRTGLACRWVLSLPAFLRGFEPLSPKRWRVQAAAAAAATARRGAPKKRGSWEWFSSSCSSAYSSGGKHLRLWYVEVRSKDSE